MKTTQLRLLFLSVVSFSCLASSAQTVIHLNPLHVSKETIQEKITCIRPARNGMIRLEDQIVDGKLIIHNYGHGSGGWSLLPGSVQEAIRIFQKAIDHNPAFKDKPITVIGAGCIGLFTAATLADRGHTVRIVAQNFENLPSHHAGGLISPAGTIIAQSKQDQERLFQLYAATYDYYRHEADHPCDLEGIFRTPCYIVNTPNLVRMNDLIDRGVLEPSKEVIIDFANGTRHQATCVMTIFVNTHRAMNRLHERLAAHQVPLIQQKVHAFSEIEDDIIFNCTALGSAHLCNDQLMQPIQGHLLTLKNQSYVERNYMIFATIEEDDRICNLYTMPRFGGVVGGTFIKNESSLTSNQHEFENIAHRAQKFFGTAA